MFIESAYILDIAIAGLSVSLQKVNRIDACIISFWITDEQKSRRKKKESKKKMERCCFHTKTA